MIAERNRHEADPVRMLLRLFRELQDALRRKRANGKVVVAGPAEPAEVRAAADDFDQEPGAELGIGREDARRRRVDSVGGLERRFAHGHRRIGRAFRGGVAAQAAVGGVLRLVERWDIETALA